MYLLCILGYRCDHISREADPPMRFISLVGERSFLAVEAFSGKYYLSERICARARAHTDMHRGTSKIFEKIDVL